MARPKEFDREEALDAAIGVFREHGYEGTSASMLTAAMRIGRQSLYDTYGDKWQLYCASVERYGLAEADAHARALRTGPRALDGLAAMVLRVVSEAKKACLGVGSTWEFGRSRQELSAIGDQVGRRIRVAVARSVAQAQVEGDVAQDLDPEEVASFLVAAMAGIRIAARGGADEARLQALGRLALRALR